MRRYSLRDDQWERIRDLLPGQEGHAGVTAADCSATGVMAGQRQQDGRSLRATKMP
jgi:hypothetical protein